jgi:two-component system, sensor histidine kinase and response regulator
MILDPEAIKYLYECAAEVEPGYIKTLIAEYRDAGVQLLDDIDIAYERHDAESLHRAAHTLKGHSLTYGASHFADLCLKLELAAKTGNLDDVAPQIRLIKSEYPAVQAALQAEIERDTVDSR